MDIDVEDVTELRFGDGSPVRAASAVVPFDGGWLVAQDDATHAAWLRGSTVVRVRLLPPVEGLDTFAEALGTKQLKPDLEAAVALPGPVGRVLLLGSGSSPRRMRGVLVTPGGLGPVAGRADLAPLYASVAATLGIAPDLLNLEGACLVGGTLRWFHRGLPSAGVPTASVDVDLAALLATFDGADIRDVTPGAARPYDLGAVGGVGLAITDAVCAGERLLVCAAAEDAPDPRSDGPVVGSVLAWLERGTTTDVASLPAIDGSVPKVEGLAVVEHLEGGAVRLLATLDADDTAAPSLVATLRVR